MRFLPVVALTVVLALAAQAQPGSGMGPRMRLIDELNLTEQQLEQVNTIRDEAMRKAIEQRSKLATLRLDVRKLFRADKPDQAAIEKKFDEITKLQAEGRTRRVQTWFAINKLLTPEQQKVWKEHAGTGRMEGMGRAGFRSRMHRDGFNRGGGQRGFRGNLD